MENKENEFELFMDKIKSAMEKTYGDEYLVQIREVNKNNGFILHGLTIVKKSEKVCPTIYLERFFENYSKGQPLSDIVKNISEIYRESDSMKPDEMGFFMDYEKVRPKLLIKLINKECNEELLKNVPHQDFLDLAVVCMVEIDISEGQTGSVLVHNNHICMWGVFEEQLLEDAMDVYYKRTDVRIVEMEKMLGDIYENMNQTDEERDEELAKLLGVHSGMYVLTNEKQLYGAACLIVPGVRQKISEKLGGDYYILPSSVHELIIMPVGIGNCIVGINEMINEVNSTMVRQDEILSNHAYLYNAETDSFKMLTEGACQIKAAFA